MLFDTDVLIWALRGSVKAARVIDLDSDRLISVIGYMELIQGARNKKEVHLIKSFLKDLRFNQISLSENIGHRAGVYMEEYFLKSGLCMADALQAAAAVETHVTLCTGNSKHYRAIAELELKIFRPE
ncbi:MAG: PIN domain-containing protein [Candidatus Wallbacteria bacterium]|nr:PIN domain-containing protein [Candidatus Wallbacteria bacterium]